jgi:hypothetical protein
MANNSHFPGLEGELIVRRADGSIREQYDINEKRGMGTVKTSIKKVDGSVEESSFEFQSFNDNFATMLLNGFEGATNNMVDTSAATGNCKDVTVEAIATDATYGIQVGLNNQDSGYDPAINYQLTGKDDYRLRLPIIEGTAVNQLNHGVVALTYTQSNGYLEITRTFTNNSAANIIVREVGITGDSGSNLFLLSRDTKVSDEYPYSSTGTWSFLALTIAPAEVLTITYQFLLNDNDGILNNFLGMMAGSSDQGAHLLGTAEINVGQVQSVSIDFNANPTYKLIQAVGGEENQGLLVGTGTSSTSRNNWQLMDIEQTLTYGIQDTATLTYPVNGWEAVQNNNGVWYVYKTRIETARTFTNSTGSAISLTEGALVMDGSAASARLPIARFKFPATITLNDTEILEMTLRISMITGTDSPY